MSTTSQPLAADAADYWVSGEMFLGDYLRKNDLRNEAGKLDFDGYKVLTVTEGYSRPHYEIHPEK